MHKTISRWIPVTVTNLFLALLPAVSMAAAMSFSVPLTGAQQVPAVETAGTGSASLTFDASSGALTWNITYSGLKSPVTMAHLHGPAAAGKDGPPVIWLSKKGSDVEGPIKGEATLTPEQAAMLKSGDLYINVHSKDHPKGELRGQVMVPMK